jgi:hypothetical protein
MTENAGYIGLKHPRYEIAIPDPLLVFRTDTGWHFTLYGSTIATCAHLPVPEHSEAEKMIITEIISVIKQGRKLGSV